MELLLCALLFLASGCFSASEVMVYRANWIRLTNWAGHKVPGARTALGLLDHQERTIVSILVGNNLVNVFSSVILAGFFARTLGPAWTSLAVAIVVVVTMIVGEYVPKTIGQAWPSVLLRRAAGALVFCQWLFWPAVTLLIGLTRLFRSSAPGCRFALTRQDFIAAMARRDRDTGAGRTPAVGPLVTRLFHFSGTTVADVLIPLSEVKAVAADAGIQAVLDIFTQYGYSRIPVYQDDPANITGVIVAKDLLAAPAFRVRKALRVAETTRAMDVLRQMQRRGEHIAVVEDAGGRVSGIVSLEDLLEELVGEIRSEA
jgi:CBS domain containing-hemolysin-like protein